MINTNLSTHVSNTPQQKTKVFYHRKQEKPQLRYFPEGINQPQKQNFVTNTINNILKIFTTKEKSKNSPADFLKSLIEDKVPQVRIRPPRTPNTAGENKKPILPDHEHLSNVLCKLKHLWVNEEGVSPQKIDKILTRFVGGESWTRDLSFYPNKKQGVSEGRKRSYKTKNGNIFVLESHTSKDGLIRTRCYLAITNRNEQLPKEDRYYLCKDGIFRRDTYDDCDAHLTSSNKAIHWINNKPY